MDIFKKQRFLVGIIIVLVLLNVIVLGSIWFGKEPPPMNFRDKGISRFEEKLGLSTGQIDSFHQLREIHFVEMNRITNDLKSTKKQLLTLLESDAVDSLAREEKINRLVELHRQIEEEQFKHFSDTRKLCTPQQQIKFDSLIQKVAVRMYFNPRKKRRGKPRN